MDEYTSQIQSAAYYLKQMNKGLNNAHVAWIIFRGLPSSFDAFSSRKYEEIGKNLDNLNISNLTAELIAEESRMNSAINNNAYVANSNTNITKMDKYCKYCNKKGHSEENCFKKHPELYQSMKWENSSPDVIMTAIH